MKAGDGNLRVAAIIKCCLSGSKKCTEGRKRERGGGGRGKEWGEKKGTREKDLVEWGKDMIFSSENEPSISAVICAQDFSSIFSSYKYGPCKACDTSSYSKNKTNKSELGKNNNLKLKARGGK